MISFNGDSRVKEQYVGVAKYHHQADDLAQKHGYCHGGKCCALGCFHGINSQEACIALNGDRLGIPEDISYLEEAVFENSSEPFAKTWPLRFIEAMPVGVDLHTVGIKIKQFMLRELLKDKNVINAEPVRLCIVQVLDLLQNQLMGVFDETKQSAAWSAARSAESAAWSAAESAESAAWSAAESAESAAWSAAESAAWSAAYEKIGEELLRLFRELELSVNHISLVERVEMLEEAVDKIERSTNLTQNKTEATHD